MPREKRTRVKKRRDKITIDPGEVHSAEGKEVWLEVVSRPGWKPKDHFLTSKDKMCYHKNYHQIKASTNYELGLQLGKIFKSEAQRWVEKQRKIGLWQQIVENSKRHLRLTEQYFPQYIEELKGYAKGAGIDFYDLWALNVEESNTDRCTTIVTNQGLLISHNEDWEPGQEQVISILQKTIGRLTTFEFYYHHTLGGCSVSINSYGFCQGINTLAHAGSQIGIPRNIIARFLSETNNPEKDFRKLRTLPRELGYSHVIVNTQGKVWNIESTEKEAVLTKPELPFVHTNHFLTELKTYEENNNSTGTYDRYKRARELVKAEMTEEELTKLISDTSRGDKISILNERTIARMIVDFKGKKAKVWLRREEGLGWVDYQLNFLD